MSKKLIDDDIRYLRKWLNEENTSPVDRKALATVLNEVINLRDRMGGSKGLHRINAHKIKFLKDQLAVSQAQIKALREALEKIVNDNFDSCDEVAELAFAALIKPTDDSALREIKTGYEAQIKVLRVALENCRLLAARHRKEDWALLILGFCAEGGVVGSVTR